MSRAGGGNSGLSRRFRGREWGKFCWTVTTGHLGWGGSSAGKRHEGGGGSGEMGWPQRRDDFRGDPNSYG